MTNLNKIVKSRDITLITKVCRVKAMVSLIVTYGCERWTIRKAERRKFDAFELWCWRKILRVPWTARRSNPFILQEIKPDCSLEGMILKAKLKYFGHIMRRGDTLEKMLIWGKVEGKKKRGRPSARWMHDILQDCIYINSSLHRRVWVKRQSTMTLIVAVVVALGLCVTSCYSDCSMQRNQMVPRGTKQTGCWKHGSMHPYFSKWKTTDCQECTCYKQGVECCSDDSVAIGYNPKICIAIKEDCVTKVVRKKDHSIKCPHKMIAQNTDSTDSSDSKDDSGKKDSDSDEGKVDLSDYLELLKLFDDPDDCEEKEKNKKSAEKGAEGKGQDNYGESKKNNVKENDRKTAERNGQESNRKNVNNNEKENNGKTAEKSVQEKSTKNAERKVEENHGNGVKNNVKENNHKTAERNVQESNRKNVNNNEKGHDGKTAEKSVQEKSTKNAERKVEENHGNGVKNNVKENNHKTAERNVQESNRKNVNNNEKGHDGKTAEKSVQEKNTKNAERKVQENHGNGVKNNVKKNDHKTEERHVQENYHKITKIIV
ncbi:myb-like protein X isoform X1 [Eleutherodactylus coqui]|uniref:myb-like protein X isoform X1 n=1 Tax=Eleutherodactylus coqui TaxID=57060 RepID=UPI0034634611